MGIVPLSRIPAAVSHGFVGREKSVCEPGGRSQDSVLSANGDKESVRGTTGDFCFSRQASATRTDFSASTFFNLLP